MDDYQNNVILRKVFSLKDGQNDILDTKFSKRQTINNNEHEFGFRLRNMKTVFKKDSG